MRQGPAAAWASVLLALVLIHAGLAVPDTDQWLPLLQHRSALTHSMLVPLFILTRWPVPSGLLAGGFAIHLAADLLSRKWVGYALVKVPLLGSLDATASQLFLAANLAVGLVLYDRAARLAGARGPLWAAFAASAAIYFAINERYWLLLLPVLAVFVLIGRR